MTLSDTTPSPPQTPTLQHSTMAPSTSAHIPHQHFNVLNHPVTETLAIVSAILSMIVQRNDGQYNPLVDPITLFHSRAVPRISIEAYLTRVLKYIPFTNEVLLNVLVFLDRIGGLEGFQLSSVASSASTPLKESARHGYNGQQSPSSPVSLSHVPSSTTTSSSSSSSSLAPRQHGPGVSCPENSFPIPPMVAKRGRDEEVEEQDKGAKVSLKRTRTSSASMESVPLDAETLAAAAVGRTSAQESAGATGNGSPPPTLNGFRVNSFNIHRLLITSLMIAAKFTSDLYYSNARYAKVGGLSLPELNQLELEFLFTARFELNVKVDEIQRVGDSLLQFRDRQQQQHYPQQQQQKQQQLEAMHHRQAIQQSMHQQPVVQMIVVPKTTAPSTTTSCMTMAQASSFALSGRNQYAIPSPSSPNNCYAPSASSTSGPIARVSAISNQVAMSQGGERQSQQQRPQLLSPPEEKHTSWSDHASEAKDHPQYHHHLQYLNHSS